MLRTMIRTASVVLLCLASYLPSQETLAQVQRRFTEEARKLDASSPTEEQRAQLLSRHVENLEQFLAKAAKDDDRWNGRLMLADLQLARSDRTAAAATLRTIEAKAAPAMVLITAAAMAQHLNLRELRDAWIPAAIAKQAPLADRLAMARMLMTVLHDVERGEAMFQATLAAATDDEQKAFVRWHRADALRDREDLPDNAGFEELERLANELPKTYWGEVARDRLRATRLQPGDDAIAFRGKTRAGAEFALADAVGKTVVLAFWSLDDRDTRTLIATLAQLQRRLGDKLAVVSVCLDREDAAIGQAVRDLGIDFPVIGNGKGIETDVALRWFVEGPAVHVIDPKGKVAGLGLHVGTADARAELTELVERVGKS